jgi:hypothetical protein
MTRIRTIRDIVVQIPNGTHTIQNGTYFYVLGDEAKVMNEGACVRVPGYGNADAWLFVGEDIDIVEDPIPF